MGTGKKLFSGKDATGKDTFYVETTDKGVKTYKEATIAEDGTTAGKAKSPKALLTLRWQIRWLPWTKRCLRLTPAFFPGCGTEPFRFCYQEPEQHREQPVRFSVRIQDADYATEVSNMSRANILQQAGTSVLAQANQSTQNVLSLLR